MGSRLLLLGGFVTLPGTAPRSCSLQCQVAWSCVRPTKVTGAQAARDVPTEAGVTEVTPEPGWPGRRRRLLPVARSPPAGQPRRWASPRPAPRGDAVWFLEALTFAQRWRSLLWVVQCYRDLSAPSTRPAAALPLALSLLWAGPEDAQAHPGAFHTCDMAHPLALPGCALCSAPASSGAAASPGHFPRSRCPGVLSPASPSPPAQGCVRIFLVCAPHEFCLSL